MSTKQTMQNTWILRDAKSPTHWVQNSIVRDTEAELKEVIKSFNVNSGEVYLESELKYKIEAQNANN